MHVLTSRLHQAIRTINSTKKWGAKVVYGDTDSLFIYLLGKTKDQAFRIGQDMADTVTSMNPAPVKLKFEKVGWSFTSILHGYQVSWPRFISRVSLWRKSVTWASSSRTPMTRNLPLTPRVSRPFVGTVSLPNRR